MTGWLLVLSFVLGFALTWLYMVRTVSRTLDPVAAASPRVRTTVTQERYEAARAAQAQQEVRRPGPPGSRVVEFEDE